LFCLDGAARQEIWDPARLSERIDSSWAGFIPDLRKMAETAQPVGKMPAFAASAS
jgi:hypothetical protein